MRRYQNPDGSLTDAGRKRMAKEARKAAKSWSNTNTYGQDYNSQLNKGVKKVQKDVYKKLRNNEGIDDSVAKQYASDLLGKYGDMKIDRTYYNYGKSTTTKDFVAKILQKEGEALGRGDFDNYKARQELETFTKTMSKSDKKRVEDICLAFKTDEYGFYESNIEVDIGGNKARIGVRSDKGNERKNAIAATSFLKKFDFDKAKEGVVKEFYDNDDYEWIEKEDTDSPEYISRKDFKDKIKIDYIHIYPEWKAYRVWWDDGGTYGYHSFVDEGSMVDMKVSDRSLQG